MARLREIAADLYFQIMKWAYITVFFIALISTKIRDILYECIEERL